MLKVQVLNDLTLRFECKNGHENIVVLQLHRFEMLAHAAIVDLINRSYGNSVSNMAKSLERFYEAYLKYSWNNLGYEPAEFENLWKAAKKQSERQYGAYVFVFGFLSGSVPPLLEQEAISLRNRVTHDGYAPTETEAKEYCQRVIDLIFHYARDSFKDQDTINSIWLNEVKGTLPENGETHSTMAVPNILHFVRMHRNNGTKLPSIDDWMALVRHQSNL